jgi:hypothetical protein
MRQSRSVRWERKSFVDLRSTRRYLQVQRTLLPALSLSNRSRSTVGLQSQFVRRGEAFGFDAYNFIAGTRSSFGKLGLMRPLRSRGLSGRIVARDGGRSGPSSRPRGADVGSIV